MKPTRVSLLFAIAVPGIAAAFTVSRLVLASTGSLIAMRAATPLATAVMTGALLWWTLIVRRRLTHIQRAKHEAVQRALGGTSTAFVMHEKPLHPIVAARTLALAFAASRAGAWVFGWYTGIALSYVGHLWVDDVKARMAYAVATSLMAVALAVVAMWLERSCKLPPPPPSAEATPA